LCDYKVWIDIERDVDAKNYLRNMVELNVMEEQFCASKKEEHKHSTYFAIQHKMDREEYRESERSRGHESVRKLDM
jgi:hypothetical protein